MARLTADQLARQHPDDPTSTAERGIDPNHWLIRLATCLTIAALVLWIVAPAAVAIFGTFDVPSPCRAAGITGGVECGELLRAPE